MTILREYPSVDVNRLIIVWLIGLLLILLTTFTLEDIKEATIYFIIGAVLLTGVIIYSYAREAGINKYEVIFDKEIDINELFEKYEYVSNDGKIWVLKDRGDG